MGPVVWDVIGSELSLREHVARQAGVKRVTVHEARGRAAPRGLGHLGHVRGSDRSNRIPEKWNF